MITVADYKSYFGVETAPSNLVRLDYLALEELKNILTKDIPLEDDDIYEDFLKALMEQIKFFYDNDDMLTIGGSGYSLGKFSEGSNASAKYNQSRISPMAYAILLNAGLLYSGLC